MEAWRIFFDTPSDEDIEQSQRYLLQQSQRPHRPRRGRAARARSPELNTQALPSHVQQEYSQGPVPTAVRLAALPSSARDHIRVSVTTAWQKLNQYYTKLGASPLFAAAIILHPGRGVRWLEARWDSGDQLEWLRDAKEGLEAFWIAWYRDTTPGSQPRPSSNEGRPPAKRSYSEYDDWMAMDLQRLQARSSEATEIERYLRLELPIPDVDPIEWWLEHKQQFPSLSRLALDLFSIPAMAADCERAFSLAKLTLTSQRLSMDPETLEMAQCLKNWIRRDAVMVGGIFFSPAAGLSEETML